MEEIRLDYTNIMNYTKNAPEYLFVDKAVVHPGEDAIGYKYVSSQDWYFRMHLPGDPILPGVFLMEAIMTTGAFTVTTMSEHEGIKLIFNGSKNVKLFHDVRPGCLLECRSKLVSFRRGVAKLEGSAYVEDLCVGEMEYTLIAPEIIKGIMEK